ncbi:MAG: tRNA (N(6)-L-threonylcarbamoyladenosine(37)-C(2))-methylthiotransferase MtaB [Clostridia bacterium]|nr:tRNA (N(6)-L-threonylcarbamoyladenosine(37)-C(2))-methylthiotransferase MtaB [Clostridia bacterium]
MKTIAAVTLGCKVNQYDTEAMLEAFERSGYTIVPFQQQADVYLVNTCTVTGTGDQKSLKTVRRAARQHPGSAIIVCGCLAQRESERIAQMEGVKLVLGVQRRAEVAELLEKAMREPGALNMVAPLKNIPFEHMVVTRHEGKTRATMKIQEGCDRYCSYCIIPSVRGPVRSMPMNEVRAEALRLANAGYPEIVLTGIHLASYGRGTPDTLLDAIQAVHNTPGIERVRLGSLEPKVVDAEFARSLAELPNLARQFHLSLQSGSAQVLRRMRRRYTPEEYYEACEILRRFMPDCAITTDVIAGFPGETEEEHMETEEFLQRVAFARIHVFPYSRREGTRADELDGQLSEAEKQSRARRLIAIGNKLEERFVLSLKGTAQRVLFEQPVGEGQAEGYTGSYVRVRANATPGTFQWVRIYEVQGATALGEAIES